MLGAEVKVKGSEGREETRLLAYPEITGAVLRATGGDTSGIKTSLVPPINRTTYLKELAATLPPGVGDALERATELGRKASGAGEAIDIAGTVLASVLAARGGPLAVGFETWRSLEKIKGKDIDYLLDSGAARDPKVAGDLIWDTVKNTGSSEALPDLLQTINESIDQGFQTGRFTLKDARAAWADVANNSYKEADAGEVYNSPRVDGPRPFTNGEYLQQYAQALVYGRAGELIDGGGMQHDGLRNDGLAYCTGALDQIRHARRAVSGGDGSRDTIANEVGSGLNYLYQHDRARHAAVVANLANPGGASAEGP